MNDTADGKRKPRSIMATDSEWSRIRERAERERIPISRYVVQQSLATVEMPAPSWNSRPRAGARRTRGTGR